MAELPPASPGTSLSDLKKAGRANSKKVAFEVEDFYSKASKLERKKRTGIVYDARFTSHRCDWDVEYPESPDRYQSIMNRLDHYGLVERCQRIPARNATCLEIAKLHDITQIDLLSSTRQMEPEGQEHVASLYDAIYFNQHTYDTAVLSAGSAIALVDAVVNDIVQNGIAVIRPPGHHATRDQFGGYCYFNNVALAAQYALDNLNLERILIVDWDVHHGQATQQMFFENNRVLYASIHRHEHGAFWPNLVESNFDHLGRGAGLGYNVNIPLNGTGCGDADYLFILQSILLPLAYEFDPELILISAGYDAALGCTEGKMRLSPGVFHLMTTSLMALARGKVAVILEGGYFLPSLSEGVAQTLRALLGDPAPMFDDLDVPKPHVRESIYNVISILRRYWKCFSHFQENNAGDPIQEPIHKATISYVGQVEQAPFPTRQGYPKHDIETDLGFKADIERLRNRFYNTAPVTRVGYVYDNRMLRHATPTGPHMYENSQRIIRALDILTELALLSRLQFLGSRTATTDELHTAHFPAYVEAIRLLPPQSVAEVREATGWHSIYTNHFTFESATLAVGSLIKLVDSVLDGTVTSGVAFIRPPGHHAERSTAAGFCFFNNIAVAAQHAVNNRGLNRVLILDLDIHHGNGIQQMFIAQKSVLYMSVHRYDGGQFYPSSSDAEASMNGYGTSLGHNVNVAWNYDVMRNVDYISAFMRVLLPIAFSYNPQLVIVAAGFDACKGDPVGCYELRPEVYGHFIQQVKTLAGGRVVLALEGGYNANSVGYSMAMCTRALLGDPIPTLGHCGRVCNSAVASINETLTNQQDYWPMLLQARYISSAVPVAGLATEQMNENVISEAEQSPEEELSPEAEQSPEAELSPEAEQSPEAELTPEAEQSPEA